MDESRVEIAIVAQLVIGIATMDKVIHLFLPFLTIAIDTRKGKMKPLNIIIVKY